MRYFANPVSPSALAAMSAGRLGYIDTPRQGNRRPAGVEWCADNGCFSSTWTPGPWWAWLEQNAHAAPSCAFAVAPDVVADAAATLELALPWLPRIRAAGYPAAYVAQDGLDSTPPPWDHFDVLFIGGTTSWKLGPEARSAVVEALARGKRVHFGRVNSARRYLYAHAIGCTSADGTFLTYGPDKLLPEALSWHHLEKQLPLLTVEEVVPA